MDLVHPPLERPKSLTELAEDRIREAIVAGDFAFGEQLSEATLAATLQISKTPVREALLRLQAEGLVEVQPQRGTFVFRLADAEVAEVCRFREIIERAALGEAMQHAPAALRERLRENIAQMAAAHASKDLARLPVLDQEFHEAIVERCGNAYLRSAYGLIGPKIRALRNRLPAANARVEHCQDNHAAILALIETGDVGRAGDALAEHIRDTLASYLEASRNGLRRQA